MQITELLGRAYGGDAEALNKVVPMVYQGFKQPAMGHLRHERTPVPIEATALVHEGGDEDLLDGGEAVGQVRWRNLHLAAHLHLRDPKRKFSAPFAFFFGGGWGAGGGLAGNRKPL